MRAEATILHLDLDAFYAAVEQRDKPSLRGRPVVVGGVGGRGVVATASYEARAFGVRSAMSTREARARCPHAAYLGGRHHIYRLVSAQVMAQLRELSPLVEPLSLDEAYVDLAAGVLEGQDADPARLERIGADLKAHVREATGGLTCSVGIGTSKLVAKIASELRKPDGLVVVPPGTERELLGPMPVAALPGVGPATAERLRRVGITTIDALAAVPEEELVALLGQAHGHGLHRLARAEDDRAVVAEREAKSISVEDTYDTDLVDRRVLLALVERQATKVSQRLGAAHLAGRTVTLKVRLHDFSTHTRSATLDAPSDDATRIVRTARRLLDQVDTTGGVRLLGVGISGLTDWVQDHLFEGDGVESSGEQPPADADGSEDAVDLDEVSATMRGRHDGWTPGADVVHDEHGRGWVWGAGLGRVTVRFETAETGPGPVRTLAAEDPALHAWRPEPVPAEDAADDTAEDAAGDDPSVHEPDAVPGP